jgi:coenzyme F420-dependent glucose-6-phosphate dehydrogenase
MTLFSYHISHEQFSPRDLLGLVRHAEAAGFDAAFSSDHLQPWAPDQGQSGFAWAWLGAAMQATERLRFGAISVPGGWRYSPAVLAQAVATLGEMFPGRIPWVALGSGQAMNEAVTGQPWPDKGERNARLREGAEIMRALLAGETVTHRGRVTVVGARLWSRPETATRLVGAATSEATAEWLGGWADGLLTVGTKPETLRRTIEGFRRGGGEGKPIYLKADLSWAATEAEALHQAHAQWRFNLLGGARTSRPPHASSGRRTCTRPCTSPPIPPGTPRCWPNARRWASRASTCTRSAPTSGASSTPSGKRSCPRYAARERPQGRS